MATIAVLDVAFRARTKKFTAGVRGAGRTVGRFVHGTAMGMKVAAAGFVALGAAVVGAGYAMHRLVGPSLRAIDSVAKMSDRLAISTKSLTGLHHAARITGTSLEGMDKALTLMARRIGEAAIGSGEGATAFRDWGLEVQSLINLAPDQQLGLIADQMNTLGSQSEKAAMAADLFGRSGVALINVLSLGSQGIEELIRQNEKLGGSFSRLDASKIEEANDAITRMKAVIEGARNSLAIRLGPTIEAVARYGAAAFATMGAGWEIWLKRMELGWARLASRVEFFAETTLPEALRRLKADPGGFLDAWLGIGKGKEGLGSVGVFFDNLATNLSRAMDNAFGGADWEYLGWFEGFEKGMADQFGEMPKRAIGELEKGLNTELLALEDAFKTKWVDVFNMKFVAPKFELDLDPEAKDILRKLAQATPGALRVGSREAYSYTVQNRYRAMAATAQKQLVEEKKIRTATERTAIAAENWVTEMAVATF